jgi:hypothetical protein
MTASARSQTEEEGRYESNQNGDEGLDEFHTRVGYQDQDDVYQS